jgi:outer membrane protein insertion porin family
VSLGHAALLALALVPGAAALAAPQPDRSPGPPAAAPQEAGAGTRHAASVKLLLPQHADNPALEALVVLERGAPVTNSAARRTVTRLYQSGRCRDVVVTESPAPTPPGKSGRWVDLSIECLPPRILTAVTWRFDGPSPLAERELKAALQLTMGEPIDQDEVERVAARARAALRQKGCLAAVVTGALEGEPGATLRLQVKAGPPTVVTAVRLPGAGIDEAGLLARLATRPGEVLLEERLRADLDVLVAGLRATGHRRGRIGPPSLRDVPDGVEVEIPVQPGPSMALEVRGVEAFTKRDIDAQLQLDGEAALDGATIDAGVERLRAFYRAHGYALARIEADERRLGEGLVVTIHVAEGRLYRLRALRVEGAEARGQAAVRERLRALLEEEQGTPPASQPNDWARALESSIPTAPPRRAPPSRPSPETVLDELQADRALQRFVEEYQNDGYLEATLLGWSVAADAASGQLDLVVRLREGERTTVDSIGFEGNVQVPLTDLAREARLVPGQPLAFDKVDATRSALLRLYLARGFLYARVEAREEVDREHHLAELRFVVEEGPRVRIGRVLVSGNLRTRDSVIRRAISVKEGEPYDPEAVARTQAALLGLGVFRSVGLRLSDAETPEAVKDLNVEVSERPWLYISSTAGFSIANGPRASVEWGQPNLLGRALELTTRAKVNYPLEYFRPDLKEVAPKNRWEGRADVGLRAPQLTPWPLAAHLDLIGERLRRRAYDMTDISIVLGTDYRLTSRITFSLQYEVMTGQLRRTGLASCLTTTADPNACLTQADLERLRFDEGTTSLHAIRPSATLDYRDDPTHPHSGWFATGSAELAHSLGASGEKYLGLFPGSDIHSNLVKLQGTLSAYLPVSRGTTLALSARGGRIYPLDGASRTIVPRRFFLGGANTMRGFAEEEMVAQDLRSGLADQAHHCASSITTTGCTGIGGNLASGNRMASEGGEAFMLFKGEFRIGLSKSVELGLFVDLGNLWANPANYRLLELRPNAGSGIRFVTPVGPAALDVGFNLLPDKQINERLWAIHFTIGLF